FFMFAYVSAEWSLQRISCRPLYQLPTRQQAGKFCRKQADTLYSMGVAGGLHTHFFTCPWLD
ncbi:hypothetical protein, partial [Serratia marcescens]|uniref:hypothetical protein n=1 Tax=Serratia marcescens TaxID=615 RepID=UPI001C378FF8